MNMLMENKRDKNHDMKVIAANEPVSMIFVPSNTCFDASVLVDKPERAVLACDHFNKGNNCNLLQSVV